MSSWTSDAANDGVADLSALRAPASPPSRASTPRRRRGTGAARGAIVPRRHRQATQDGRDLRGREALPLREQQHLAIMRPEAASASCTSASSRSAERLPRHGRRFECQPLLQREPAAARPPLVRDHPAAPSRTATPALRRLRAPRPDGATPSGTPRPPHPARRSPSRPASRSRRRCPSRTTRTRRRSAAFAHARFPHVQPPTGTIGEPRAPTRPCPALPRSFDPPANGEPAPLAVRVRFAGASASWTASP